jgi:hypothetical protein
MASTATAEAAAGADHVRSCCPAQSTLAESPQLLNKTMYLFT